MAKTEEKTSLPAPELAAITGLSFEAAMKELEVIVRKLESGAVDLEAAITDYTRGMALKDHCATLLSSAKMKVEAIVKAEDGSVTGKPFESN